MEKNLTFPVRIISKELYGTGSYMGAEIVLPASKSELIDALERARVPEGSGEYYITAARNTPDYLAEILRNKSRNPSLNEVNYFARRMNQLDEIYPSESDNYLKIPGMAKIRDSYDIIDLINCTANTDQFICIPAENDGELGEIALESGFIIELDSLPDDLADCFDLEKLGAAWRKREGAALVDGVAVFPNGGEWKTVYVGEPHLRERAVAWAPEDPMLRIRITMSEEDAPPLPHMGWVTLPAKPQDFQRAMREIGAGCLEDCRIAAVESKVTLFEYSLADCTEIDQVNTLAGILEEKCAGQITKLKAALEYEDISELENVIDLARNLDRYEFVPPHLTGGISPYDRTRVYGQTAWGYVRNKEARAVGRSFQTERSVLEVLRESYPPGSPVKLGKMQDETGMPTGLQGVVTSVDHEGKIHVDWQNGRTLPLLPGIDIFTASHFPEPRYRDFIETRYPPGAAVRVEHAPTHRGLSGQTGTVEKVDDFANIHIRCQGQTHLLDDDRDLLAARLSPERLEERKAQYPPGAGVWIMEATRKLDDPVDGIVESVDEWGMLTVRDEQGDIYRVDPDRHFIKLEQEQGPSMTP